jgi:hypothetical protein
MPAAQTQDRPRASGRIGGLQTIGATHFPARNVVPTGHAQTPAALSVLISTEI